MIKSSVYKRIGTVKIYPCRAKGLETADREDWPDCMDLSVCLGLCCSHNMESVDLLTLNFRLYIPSLAFLVRISLHLYLSISKKSQVLTWFIFLHVVNA